MRKSIMVPANYISIVTMIKYINSFGTFKSITFSNK